MLNDADKGYLRKLMTEGYSGFDADTNALATCERLELAGFCRVVWDGPAWRVYMSPEQTAAGRAICGLTP